MTAALDFALKDSEAGKPTVAILADLDRPEDQLDIGCFVRG